MSERIKELMQEAGTDTSGKWMGVEHAEKFAELIVKKCIDVLMTPPAMKWDEGLRSELSDYNRGWVCGVLLGIEHIKEHFGIQE